jgi:hypothetical protein
MKPWPWILTIMLTVVALATATKKPASIQWKPQDCSAPLLLPEGQFDVSQYGKGKYRVDGAMSQGHFNCIYITFQATNSLTPAVVTEARESPFAIKEERITWRAFKTTVEGRKVIRKEALLPNFLPHENRGHDSDFIWLRIDADSEQILDQLTPVAEGILRDAAGSAAGVK